MKIKLAFIWLLRILGYAILGLAIYFLISSIWGYAHAEDRQHSSLALALTLMGVVMYGGLSAAFLIIASRLSQKINKKAGNKSTDKVAKIMVLVIFICSGALTGNYLSHRNDYLEDEADSWMTYNLHSAQSQVSIYAAKNNRGKLPESLDTPGVRVWNDDLSKVSYRIIDAGNEIYELCGIFKYDTTDFYKDTDISKPAVYVYFNKHKAGKQCYQLINDRTGEQ